MSTNRINSLITNIEAVIAEHGWGVVVVAGDSEQPSFAYTLGLADKDLPELLVIGLPPPTAHGILNDAARIAVNSGGLEEGRLLGGVAKMALQVRALDPAIARRVCRMAAVRTSYALAVSQIVWPSPEGACPGEPGCAEQYAIAQDPSRLI